VRDPEPAREQTRQLEDKETRHQRRQQFEVQHAEVTDLARPILGRLPASATV